jgi:hypothetical protein
LNWFTDALESGQPIETVMGPVKFDGKGDILPRLAEKEARVHRAKLREQGFDGSSARDVKSDGDYDPTNALAVRNDHIVVARGRDFSDASPIESMIVYSGSHRLEVEVDVAAV